MIASFIIHYSGWQTERSFGGHLSETRVFPEAWANSLVGRAITNGNYPASA